MTPDALRSLTNRLRGTLGEARQALQAGYPAGGPQRLLRGWVATVDTTLREVWRNLELPPGWTLAAVGGYGRRELLPYSDVDLLILVDTPVNDLQQPALDRLVGLLWDIGLEVGHSVRTIDECLEAASADISIQTNLLEARRVAGSDALFRQFRVAFAGALDAALFVRAKRVEQEQRHARQQDAASSLEPNIKEAPGGLRDLHVVLWMARACGIGERWSDLARAGLVTRVEAAGIARQERFLHDLRIRLHRLAGRREDRLLFDWQTRLAEEMGFASTRSRRASEQLMQRYYRTARSVNLLNTILLRIFESRLRSADRASVSKPVDSHFVIRDGLLDIARPEVFEQHPPAILRAFVLLAQHPGIPGLAPEALRQLWRARRLIDAQFRRDPRNIASFLELLDQPHGVTHNLRRMNRYGILGRYLPEFGRIVGQMQHDLFHVYTVDEHILMVLRNLRRFAQAEFAHEYPLCSRLMSEFDRPAMLYVAALYHDIAKGRGGDHSTLGARDVRAFCRRHGIGAADQRLCEWLVDRHLLMSSTAQKQDLSDPAVIARFCSVVPDERALTALYLLTVADIRGTSPKVWNAWKGKLLTDLYQLARRQLRGETGDTAGWLQTRQAEAGDILRRYALDPVANEAFWGTLEPEYFLRHEPADIAWHARAVYRHHRDTKPHVSARPATIGDGLQVLVYAPEHPDLFARTTGYFERLGYSIVEARLHSTRCGRVLYDLLVLDPARQAHSYRDVISLIEHELARVLDPQQPLQPPVQGRISRRVRHFPITPEISLRTGDSQQLHILTVIAADRPGLLSRMARVFLEHRVSVHSAKINTLRERAEDSFLVSGAELGNAHRVARFEDDLANALLVA